MKILFLTPWYPDDDNPGHGTFVRDQVLAISRHHEVQVVCAKINYRQFGISTLSRKDTTRGGVRESLISVKQSLPVFNQLNFFVRVLKETLRIARDFHPDLIHGNIGYPGAFWSWMTSKSLDIPYVITEHTRITNNFRSFAHRQLTLFGLRRADSVVAVSRWHADEIQSYTGVTPVVIPNVIRFSDIPEPGAFPPTNEYQIGFLGGLNTPVKGLDVLLRAASMLEGNFKLHIGGDGTLLDKYKQQAIESGLYDRCVFYGRIPQSDVYTFMNKLHLFVSASRWETFGIAMVEALASGLPVVATDSGGSREFIDESNGVLVPPDSSEGMLLAISTVMQNLSSYDRHLMSTSVRARFSTDKFLQMIDSLYETATVQPKQG